MKLFYTLWSQAINREEKIRGKENGRIYAFLFITFCQGLNFMTVLLTFKTIYLVDFNVFLNIDIFPNNIMGGMISGFLTMLAPFMVINYFVIFKGKRYLKIKDNYQTGGSNLYFGYVFFSFITLFLPIVIGFILSRV